MPAASKSNIKRQKSRIDGAYHTVEWLITAFAGTLVFIVFVMQVYRIPTGSMAETLRGAHFRVRCGGCGYRYDHDFIAEKYKMSNMFTPSKKLPIGPRSPRCPSCGYAEQNPIRDRSGRYSLKHGDDFVPAALHTVFKGDQIFVLKCIYQFFQPKRWDVIVFKNPLEPRINYIKRCVGLPGETLQIVDGDIYINGQIQRKPQKVQEELWMVVYDNDYQPVRPGENRFNDHSWKQPFEKVPGSAWNLSAGNPFTFELDTDNDVIQRIQYNDKQGNDFHATYGYDDDDPGHYPFELPICSDLMITYYLDMQAVGAAGAQIRKYGVVYQGWIKADGSMEIARLTPGGQPISLQKGQYLSEDLQKTTRFRFAAVDHQVVLEYGSAKIVHDLGTGMDDAGTDRTNTPQVQILGYGKLKLTHIGLYRDIHYISENILRASKDKPVILKDNEFFACGDNSPFSLDSRLWNKEGIGNNGTTYPAGVVPKDYLVGKGIVVHWPGGYRVGTEPIRWIPFVDGMKVIYGGK